MKKVLLGLVATLAAASIPSISYAQFSGNVSLTSDYRYRGISQTRLKPALQGGLDYGLPGGFYIGTWASTIKWIKDAQGDANLELDLYGGYKGEITKEASYDVGLLQYLYPSAKTAAWDAIYKDPNTTEIYGALTYGPVTAKLSYALTNLFGNYNFATNEKSKGSYYFDLSGTWDLGSGVSIVPHIGYQKVEHIDNASYTDYSVTLSKDLGAGFSVSGAIVGTDADKNFYVPGVAANSTKFLGKTSGVVSVKYVF